MDHPTIFALSSGRGKAGVAVVRISGPAAGLALDRMAPPRPAPRRAAFRRILDPSSGELLDAALVLYFEAPSSETGEDIAELQLHGSPAVVRSVFRALGAVPGCRLAEPGEFARRAFLNGKIDLTAAEGLADLIDAETDAQRRQALAQAGGAFARLCDGWRDTLLEARALAEAAIDFSDEGDVASDALVRALALAGSLLADIERHLDDGHLGEIVRDGFRITIAGPPNVGKSSLLNALARRDVAIVSPEPGTTRDILEVHLDLGGYAVVLADTAGLRDAPGAVEREGVRRAEQKAREADLVIWLVDATAPEWRPPPDLFSKPARMLVVLNKCELATDPAALISAATERGGPRCETLEISALTGRGLPELLARITAVIAEHLEPAASAILPTQARHRAALSDCAAALRRLTAGMTPVGKGPSASPSDPSPAPPSSRGRRPAGPEGCGATNAGAAVSAPQLAPELVAEELRAAADALGRITGRVDAEAVLGIIFGRFCIGK